MSFIPYDRSQRVRLTADLTSYRTGLVPGVMGWTDPATRAQWGVIVHYDNGQSLDTLWRSLEVMEEATKDHRRDLNLAKLRGIMQVLLTDGMSIEMLKAQCLNVIAAARKAARRKKPKATEPGK